MYSFRRDKLLKGKELRGRLVLVADEDSVRNQSEIRRYVIWDLYLFCYFLLSPPLSQFHQLTLKICVARPLYQHIDRMHLQGNFNMIYPD